VSPSNTSGGGKFEIDTTHIAAFNVGSVNFNVLLSFVEKKFKIKGMVQGKFMKAAKR
jgi:hypothetical protein